MALRNRLDRFQRGHAWLGFPLAVVYKFVDDQGGYLAALLTYYGFLSLFPLLLLFVTVLGYALHGNPGLQEDILGSALRQFPVLGTQLERNVHGMHGSVVALVFSALGLVYGGLGIAQAGQLALNRVWGVPRHKRPNPIKARIRGGLLLAVLGAAALATTGLSALGVAGNHVGSHPIGVWLRVLAALLAIVLNVALFVAAFRVLTARDVALHDVLLGAVFAGIAWELLQLGGAAYVAPRLRGATEVYGTFGLVLGLIGWLYLEAIVVVLSAEVNVVRARHLWPRALLTPFTDNVRLTGADERAYTQYAETETYKGFEDVDVQFRDRKSGSPSAPGAPGAPEHKADAESGVTKQ